MRSGASGTSYRSLYKESVLTDRERKNIILLDVIRRNGPIAKTDIARITKHNIVTVSNYVEHYIKKKLLLERGLDVSSGGRRPELVELNADWGYVLGVDIAHATISVIVARLNSKIIQRASIARPKGHMETVLVETTKLVHKVIADSKVEADKIKGIGVGISGVVDKNAGTVRDTDESRGSTIGSYETIKNMLEKEFNVPVLIANDASLAALGEKKLSLRIDDENIIFVYGDVGTGIITNNELFVGTSWSAGEIQLNFKEAQELGLPKWVTDSNYFKSRGPSMGIVEDVQKLVAANGKTTKVLGMANNKPENITSELIFKAIQDGDEALVPVVEQAVTLLGLKISYLVNFLNPEVVVIGGGFEAGGDFVLNRIRNMVKKLVSEEASSIVKIILSRLSQDAVTLGAASLVTQNIFAEI